jgi:branched-chain amino acid transport system permease protein
MDSTISLFLVTDGITNGAIYALVALALVLVFAVTRVILIQQGEFVTYGALTLGMLDSGQVPPTVWLLVAVGALVAIVDSRIAWRDSEPGRLGGILARQLGLPLGLAALLYLLPLDRLPEVVRVLLALAVVIPLGPMMYRLIYQPIASASVLVLLIISVAVHLAMVGLGLLFFGAEGRRIEPFSDASFEFGSLIVSGQSLWVVTTSLLLVFILYRFFGRTIYGKALRATAMNRDGARLMGISPVMAGRLSFTLAAAIGTLSGILIGPLTTIYYDTGFLIGLKGFVAAIFGALSSYPLAAIGALLVGQLESFASFWASAYKEVIVFTLIIPVLLWRSLQAQHIEEDE